MSQAIAMRVLSRLSAGRWCVLPVLFLALIGSAGGLSAQADVIRGRVTGVDGQPLAGARVTATSIPGNVTRATHTNERGLFQIAFPGGSGDYMLGYAVFGYAYRQVEVKRVADEDVLVADARLAPVQLDSLLVTAPARQRVDRFGRPVDVSGTERDIAASDLPPELRGDVAAMAASLPGVLLVPGLDGQADGFSVLGLGSDQNSVTLNGLQTGANGLPRDAGISTSLATSPYDVSRGGFSGANFNIRSLPGSNLRRRGSSLVLTAPQLQWTDAAGRALGNDYTNVSLGGVAAGPIKPNGSFYNVSYQLGRQARENPSLLGTDALGLRTAGVAADSVARLLQILQAQGIASAPAVHPHRLNDDGSVFGSVDLSPPGMASGQSFGLTFNGRWSRQTPVGGGATALASAAGRHMSWSGGLQARHSGYLGMLLSESSLGVNLSRDYDDPLLALPSGRVLVSSLFPDGTSGVQTLTFGGTGSLGSATRATSGSLQSSLSWFDNGNKHRLKLATELQYGATGRSQGGNLLGTFNYNSLADLAAGAPASYSRTLTARARTTGLLTAALSLGDSYRRTENLQLQYGLRLDATRYTTRPSYNPLVESTFGRRNDQLPTPLVPSGRVGFSWTLGRAQEVASFVGAARAPRAVLRGGVGIFANAPAAGQIASALDNTGLPDGIQQVACVGPAVPSPIWSAYGASPASIPVQCADGSTGTVFANAAPGVVLFARDFSPARSVRSNLSWTGSLFDGRYSLSVDGTYSLNLGLQRGVDLNFRPLTRFTTADDGRPVYVEPGSIVPATGTVAAADVRVSSAFARVTDMRSDLRSRTAQMMLRLSPIQRSPGRFTWSAAYTYTHVREQISGFASTAGSPLAVQWAPASQGPHQINYTLRYNFFDALAVSWSGSVRSGMAFTPMVGGDVNGDGYWNDRAYVASPSAAVDPAVAEGMRQLLAAAPGATRHCLEGQLGAIAARNSCTGPWTSSATLNVTLDRARFRMPDRGAISFSVSNPLGAADLLAHGSEHLHGWGQAAFPDQNLLYVRGFDPETQRFRYEVNQRFGATRPQFLTLRAPVVLTLSVRIDLGPAREQQNLLDRLGGRVGAGSRPAPSMLRSMIGNDLPDPLAAILRTQDTLRLTAPQADSIAAMNRRYTYRADSLWTPVTRYLATLPPRFDDGAAWQRYLEARRAQIAMLAQLGPAVRGLLTPEQRRKLPSSLGSLLDPRYLALIRNGTRLYADSGNPFMGMDMGMFDGVVTSFSTGGNQVVIIMRGP
jgi:hypothetical protein